MNKIRIPMPSLEDAANNKRVEEDRSVTIEAAVVRIMKVHLFTRKQMLINLFITLSFRQENNFLISNLLQKFLLN